MARKRTPVHPAVAPLSGPREDGYIYKKFRRGGGCFARRPRFDNFTPAAGTRAGNERWRQATAYASAVWQDPVLRKFYETLARKRYAWRAYNLATGDFMNPPEIVGVELHDYTGRRGGTIAIRTVDDIGVIGIRIEIRDTSGKLWEYGLAELAPEPRVRRDDTVAKRQGRYTATQDIPAGTELEIEIGADDRAGNRTAERHRFTVPG